MNTASHSNRRHDLDALRAVAMLLGILLHGSLSFFDVPWPVQDTERNAALGLIFFNIIHGFRMPVFFVMSGFFTAMLWKGQKSKLAELTSSSVSLNTLLQTDFPQKQSLLP